jgi:hypothetical protein
MGGSALAAQLVSKMTGALAAASSFKDIIMRRVLGCRGSESIARTVRAEISRMVHQRPICKYMGSLQVMPLRGYLSGVVTVLWSSRWKQDGVYYVTGHPVKGSSEQGCFKQTPSSAPQLKTYALMLLSSAAYRCPVLCWRRTGSTHASLNTFPSAHSANPSNHDDTSTIVSLSPVVQLGLQRAVLHGARWL